jgi:hypothetical protein
VNIAEETIGWLASEQLRVDEQWSYLLPTGFTWWPDQYSQTVEIVGEETGPIGETGYLVCVRTELLRDLSLTERALVEINALPMRCAAMSGPVYDVAARRLDLWSLARVDEANGSWMRSLLAAAAVTQIAEARWLAPLLADATGALPATSEHPESGPRSVPHAIASAATVFVRSGDQQCAWTDAEFEAAVTGCMNRPPALRASAAGRGFTVEFPFGETASLCRVIGDQPHPLYGNGLLVLQQFPVDLGDGADSATEGIRLALSLNAADLTREVSGYGFGSYVYSDAMIHFTGFIPNALHRPGLLAGVYFSCAARAHAMQRRFAHGSWDADAYSLDARVLARRQQQQEQARPPVERRGCPMMQARP